MSSVDCFIQSLQVEAIDLTKKVHRNKQIEKKQSRKKTIALKIHLKDLILTSILASSASDFFKANFIFFNCFTDACSFL